MVPPDFFTLTTLAHAVEGLVVGAALYGAYALWRDWQSLIYRFKRHRRISRGDLRALQEPAELEGYLPNALTDEERRNLPRSIGLAALAGAATMAANHLHSDFAKLLFLSTLAGITMVGAISNDGAGKIDADTADRAEGISLTKRLSMMAGAVATLALPVIFYFDLWNRAAARLGISGGDMLHSASFIAMIALFAISGWRLLRRSPDHLDENELEEWDQGTAFTFMAGMFIAVILALSYLV